MKYLTAISILLLSHGLYAGGHDDSEPFEGLISSEIFDLDGKMDMHVERKISSSGTLVYVLMIKSKSTSGRNTQKTSTGLKELTGFMEEMQIHPL